MSKLKDYADLKYSYKFGEKVVQQLTDRYARGTNLLARAADISSIQLKSYLILCVCNEEQLRWEVMKRMIKACEHETFAGYERLSRANRRKYLSYVKKLEYENVFNDDAYWKNDLTWMKKCQMI